MDLMLFIWRSTRNVMNRYRFCFALTYCAVLLCTLMNWLGEHIKIRAERYAKKKYFDYPDRYCNCFESENHLSHFCFSFSWKKVQTVLRCNFRSGLFPCIQKIVVGWCISSQQIKASLIMVYYDAFLEGSGNCVYWLQFQHCFDYLFSLNFSVSTICYSCHIGGWEESPSLLLWYYPRDSEHIGCGSKIRLLPASYINTKVSALNLCCMGDLDG